MDTCNTTEVLAINQYMEDFMTIINTSTFNRDGNGAFIHSCYTHCEAMSGSCFNKFTVVILG